MPLFTVEENRLADSIGTSDLTIFLHTALPTDSAPASGRTAAGGGAFVNGATLAAASISAAANGDIDNDVAVDFGTATADVGIVVAWSAYRGAAPVCYRAITPRTVNIGDSFLFNANTMAINGSST